MFPTLSHEDTPYCFVLLNNTPDFTQTIRVEFVLVMMSYPNIKALVKKSKNV